MRILLEDTLEQQVKQAENQIDNLDVATKGDIEQTLDRALVVAKRCQQRGSKQFTNVLIIGEGGTGKTQRVRAWARANGINLFEKNAKSLDETDLGGIISRSKDGETAVRLATTEMDSLDLPNSVLFLDEYNRARKQVRSTLLTLINDHVIDDPRENSGVREFPNFLFTIAAINPPTPGYNTDELDAAELSRFKQIVVHQDKMQFLDYITKELKKDLQNPYDEQEEKELKNKLNLITKLLSSNQFTFDSAEEVAAAQMDGYPALNYRSLTNLLYGCDGTKKDFLAQWDSTVNPAKKEMAERILADYQDVDNKANSVFKGDSRPEFMKGPSVWDKIKNNL